MGRILAIDPGNTHSAFVVYEPMNVVEHGKVSNDDMLLLLLQDYNPAQFDDMVVEMIASYGMAVGKTVFETCVWIGRFMQCWNGQCKLAYRKDIKTHLCGSTKAKDANIRQALIDYFPPSGQGAIPQIGNKANPGPLYGITKDRWAALAVAVYWDEHSNGVFV
ncbi:MAG: hypothetical protein HGA87_03275 [Desulfobulbaceae bacterium]|nr:hypothetical protein [Desulfobulbaceae bacterium]